MTDVIEFLEQEAAREEESADLWAETCDESINNRRRAILFQKGATEIKQLRAHIARLQEAISLYEIGVCAVAIHHKGEREVMRNCVNGARKITKELPQQSLDAIRREAMEECRSIAWQADSIPEARRGIDALMESLPIDKEPTDG